MGDEWSIPGCLDLGISTITDYLESRVSNIEAARIPSSMARERLMCQCYVWMRTASEHQMLGPKEKAQGQRPHLKWTNPLISTELVTCTPRLPFISSLLQCDLSNLLIQVQSPPADLWTSLGPAIVGSVAAILGAVVGAFIGVGHSRKVLAAENIRHQKERTAQLLYVLDEIYRKTEEVWEAAPKTRLTLQEDRDDIVGNWTDLDFTAEAKNLLAEAMSISTYLSLIASEGLANCAADAVKYSEDLIEIFTTRVTQRGYVGVWLSDYAKVKKISETARSSLITVVKKL